MFKWDFLIKFDFSVFFSRTTIKLIANFNQSYHKEFFGKGEPIYASQKAIVKKKIQCCFYKKSSLVPMRYFYQAWYKVYVDIGI